MRYFINVNFNILVYGVGSKRNFINNFILTHFSHEPCLIVNGFHSGANMKAITNPMIKFINKTFPVEGKCSNSIHDQIEFIKRTFETYKPNQYDFQKYFIVIHSMDIGTLKNDEWQKYLSELASVDAIQMIVSVDNIKAGIMWSEQMLDRFNFLGFEVNTF